MNVIYLYIYTYITWRFEFDVFFFEPHLTAHQMELIPGLTRVIVCFKGRFMFTYIFDFDVFIYVYIYVNIDVYVYLLIRIYIFMHILMFFVCIQYTYIARNIYM